MSPLDASFLHIENEVNHMHFGVVAIFEGPTPAYDEIADMVSSKLHLVPRYRQVARFVPFELSRPVWTDDPHFHLRYHLRHTALPAPGGEEQLRNLVGRVMAQPLDRARPLWEMWIAEGLQDGCWVMLSKTHHCMIDGISGSDLMAVLLDDAPDAAHPAPPGWSPHVPPSGFELIRDAVVERATRPREVLRSVRSAFRAPRRSWARLRELGASAASLSYMTRAVDVGLNGPIGPHRRWDYTRIALEDVKCVRRALGGTVNDVVLAAITMGFRQLLRSRGQEVEGQVVRTMVPVSVRRADERGAYNNRVSAMFAELPVGIADPVARLRAIRNQMEDLKEKRQAVAAEVLTSLSGFAPPLLLALGERLMARLNQHSLQTVTTNVPGPQRPMYAVGRRLRHAMPYVPLAGSLRIAVAVFSYAGELSFGITGDYDTVADIHVLCHGIEAGLEELRKRAGDAGGASGISRPRAGRPSP